MSKWLKAIYSLLGLVLLSLLGCLVWLGASGLTLPPTFNWLQTSFSLTGFWEGVAYNYVFWSATVLFVLLLLLLLGILFFPRTYSEFKLEDNKGSLKVKKSAIDGLVTSLLKKQAFMKDPAVTTKLYKHKFVVKVDGQVLPRYDILQATSQLQEQLTHELSAYLGLNQPVDFSVVVTHLQREEAKPSKTSRVR